MPRFIASVKIDEDNAELMDSLIATREFSKIVNYCLRAYRNKLIISEDKLPIMRKFNLENANQLLDFAIKKTNQYEALQKSLSKSLCVRGSSNLSFAKESLTLWPFWIESAEVMLIRLIFYEALLEGFVLVGLLYRKVKKLVCVL